MLNILLTGSTGHIGSKIRNILEKENVNLFLPTRISKFDEYHLDKIDILIHAATSWNKESINYNVNFLKKLLDSLNKKRIKKILILSSASIIKDNNINNDCLKYGNDYIKSKYLQFVMVSNHYLYNKCYFLFVTMVIDHKDRINQLPLLYKYGRYLLKGLPKHSFHMIHSEDVAIVCNEVMKIEKPKKIYIIGLPKIDFVTFLKYKNIKENYFYIPFFLVKIFTWIFSDSWTFYNVSSFLDQSYDVVNPESFGLCNLFNYKKIIDTF